MDTAATPLSDLTGSNPRIESFWGSRAYQLVIASICAFLVLTTLAMFIYPGGTSANKTTTGYQFFTNFFSDLGRTVAHDGQPNGVASLLFTVAMVVAGGGLALFFVAFTRFFTRPTLHRVLSALGTVFGVLASLGFMGVGLTPANVNGPLHGSFVLGAFGVFLAATVLYSAVILRDPAYPNRYAWPFVMFALLLAAYMYLITQRPQIADLSPVLIQATGQKIIVYASLASILLQSVAAQQVAARRL